MSDAEAVKVLREWVVSELDAVLAEMRVPWNTGLIAESKIRHLQQVLAAWPDVTIHGKLFDGLRPADV